MKWRGCSDFKVKKQKPFMRVYLKFAKTSLTFWYKMNTEPSLLGSETLLHQPWSCKEHNLKSVNKFKQFVMSSNWLIEKKCSITEG